MVIAKMKNFTFHYGSITIKGIGYVFFAFDTLHSIMVQLL